MGSQLAPFEPGSGEAPAQPVQSIRAAVESLGPNGGRHFDSAAEKVEAPVEARADDEATRVRIKSPPGILQDAQGEEGTIAADHQGLAALPISASIHAIEPFAQT